MSFNELHKRFEEIITELMADYERSKTPLNRSDHNFIVEADTQERIFREYLADIRNIRSNAADKGISVFTLPGRIVHARRTRRNH